MIIDHYRVGSLSASICTLLIAGLVLMYARRNPVARMFGVYTMTISGWAMFWFMMYQSRTSAENLLWSRLLHWPAIMIPPTFLHFTQRLLRIDQRRKQVLLRLASYLVGIVLLPIIISELFIPSVSPKAGFRFFLDTGPAYGVYAALFGLQVVLVHALLLNAYRREKNDLKKTQLTYILAAYIFGYSFGMTSFLPCYGYHMPRFSFYGIYVTHLIITYAILRHRLLEIRLVLKRVGLIALIYIALIGFLIPVGWLIYPRFLGLGWTFLSSVLAFGAVLSLGPFLYAYLIRRSAFFQERVISGVTHEFKSPLACIQSAAETLAHEVSSGRGLDARKGMLADYILMIQNNGERLERFVNDLLETSKIEQGKTQLRMESSNLDEICRKTVETYRVLAEQKGIKMEFVPNGSQPVMCDPDKIQMVVSNLVSNALKFTSKGSVRVSVETSPKQAKVIVEDTGIGIPPEDLPYIFDKFYRAGNAEETKGTGLGLAIVKGWVEAHGGRVSVESKGRGEGTRILAEIPRGTP